MPMNPHTFLALGDSYTIGEGVESAQRWPAQLVQMLHEKGIPVAEPVIIATTGWTTDELDSGINAASPVGPFDIVSLLIGVNNQYRGRSVEEYRDQFTGLLNRAISFAGGLADRVVVLSIPDWGVTPFAEGRDRPAIAMEIDRFNSVKREVASQCGVAYVDITPVSRQAASDGSLLAGDGLHPSGTMYRVWAELVLPWALSRLKDEQ